MKKFLHKSYAWLIMLVAMFAMSGSAWADEVVTINGAYESSKNGVTLSGGTPSNTMYIQGYYISSGILTIEAPVGKAITEIIINDYNYSAKASTSVGNYNYDSKSKKHTWTGNATKVVFTENSTDPWVAQTIKVTLVEENGGSVDPNPGTGEGGDEAGGGEEEFPKEGIPYRITNNACGLYLCVIPDPSQTWGTYPYIYNSKDVRLSSTPQDLYFTKKSGGYTITTKSGLFVGKHSGNTWNMNAENEEIWTIEKVDGGYAFKAASSNYLGFDAVGEDARAFRNKAVANYGTFTITEAPNIDPSVTVASKSFEEGEVYSFGPTLTFNLTANAAESNTAVPSTVKFKKNGVEQTISSFNYTEGSSTVTITLPNAITEKGDYTLTIPQETILCEENKANAEIIFSWTVKVAKPAFPVEGTPYKLTIHNSTHYSGGGYINVITDAPNGANNGAALRNKPEQLYFTWNEEHEAFVVKDNENHYLGGAIASNTWSMNYGIVEYWTLNEASTGVYTFKAESSSYMGFNTNSGYAYRNCGLSDDVYFTIEECTNAPAAVKGYDSETGKYYGTYYAEYSWIVPDGCMAYVVTDVTDGQMILTQLSGAGYPVAAEHSVIIESETQINSVDIEVANTVGVSNVNNMLGGSLITQLVGNDGAKYYALSKKNGKLGFYWDPVTQNEGATVECPAHKAYLRVPANYGSSNALSFRFDGVITGINNVNIESTNAPVYNLQGQRVNATKAGVYVKNGKKFIVK